jgi:hypothetical protein
MPIREIIPSPYLDGLPRLSDLARHAQRAAPPPPAATAAPAEPIHPALQRGIEALGDGRPRDTVRDAPDQPPAFSYRTPPEVLDRLPEPARALLRRLDRECTEARDVTISLGRHIDAASDRIGSISIDLQALLRAAKRADLQTVEDARRIAKSPGATGPERAWAERIIAEADRLAEARAEHADLVRRRREHAERSAPLTALRQRLTEAAARLRPPVRELALPSVDAKKAEKVLGDSRREIGDLRAEIERLETAPLHPADAPDAVAAAVAHLAERTSPHRFLKVVNGAVTLHEPHPVHHAEDEAPIAPLALLASAAPDIVTRWLLGAVPTDAKAPRAGDRPRLLAEARARLREAELAERGAIAAMGDDLALFRPDADPLIVLAVEAGR